MRVKHMFNADIKVWGNPVPDGFGNYNYDDPTIVKGRWQNTQEWVRSMDGTEKVCSVIVYSLYQFSPGERLSRGIDSELKDARKVESFKECQDIKGRTVMHKAWLA